MNSGPKLLSAALLILAAIAGVYFLTGDNDNGGDVPNNAPPTIGERPVDPEIDPASIRTVDNGQGTTPTRGPIRTETPQTSETFDPGQGLEGTVIDPRGNIVVGAGVFLFEDNSQNLAAQLFAQNNGAVRRPVAEAMTDENGRFKLGVREITAQKRFELWITTDYFADFSRQGILLYNGQYFEMKPVQLKIGVAVSGVVVDKRTGSAIPSATVQLIPPTVGFQAAAVPGRQLTTSYRLQTQTSSTLSGLEVLTDNNGFFRIENAPVGGARLVAFADSYARQEKQNVNLADGSTDSVRFELSAGMELGGLVVNANSEPIRDAKVTAIALSNVRGGQAETLTGEDGQFLLRGLEEGPYTLLVIAPGYIRPEALPPVEAGTLDEVIQLEQKGTVLVQVVDGSTNRRITDFSFLVRTFHPAQDQVGQSIGNQMTNVSGRDLEDGYYQIRDVDPGRQYKLEVRARGYAMTFSDAFEVVRGGQEPSVVVRMMRGGSLTAQILTPDGQPLRGAAVRTLPNDHQNLEAVPWLEALRVWNITRATTTSSATGVVELEGLTPGVYQLEITHPDYSQVAVQDIEVFDGQPTELGGISLVAGTQVTGQAYVDGQPAAQVKITITKAPDATDQPMFTAIAFTDSEGNYQIAKRLPPGRYQVQAMRTGGGPSAIFNHLADLRQTERQFTVQFGQSEHTEVFRIQ
ncbi:MAG: carboxypeptidase-like regulatory domain-containing protein [Planctomycetota bacterium]